MMQKNKKHIIGIAVIVILVVFVVIMVWSKDSSEDNRKTTNCENESSASVINDETTVGMTENGTINEENGGHEEVDSADNSGIENNMDTINNDNYVNATDVKENISDEINQEMTDKINQVTNHSNQSTTSKFSQSTTLGTVGKEEETTKKSETIYANHLVKFNNATVTPENLGVPVEFTSAYGTNILARNIWDMKSYGGKVFISSGDYEKNTGKSPIYYLTNDSTKLESTTCALAAGGTRTALNTEAVERMFMINGGLYTLATDPVGQPASAGYYKYNESSNTWQEYAVVEDAVHLYDMVEYDGKIFIGGMILDVNEPENSTQRILGCVSCINKSDLGKDVKASKIDFYLSDGVTKYPTKVNYTYYTYWRVYDMFVYKNELYAIHHKDGGSVSTGLFKYNKSKNAFVMVEDGKVGRGVISVANMRTGTTYAKVDGAYKEILCSYDFNSNKVVNEPLKIGMEYINDQSETHGDLDAKLVVGNTVVLVKNGIYKANGVSNFSRVSLGSGCEDYVTRDAFELDGKYYFLASKMNGKDNYTTTIFETDSSFNVYRKVVSMDTKSFARSFAYNEGYLYVGLGSNVDSEVTGASEYSGTILRVDLR